MRLSILTERAGLTPARTTLAPIFKAVSAFVASLTLSEGSVSVFSSFFSNFFGSTFTSTFIGKS